MKPGRSYMCFYFFWLLWLIWKHQTRTIFLKVRVQQKYWCKYIHMTEQFWQGNFFRSFPLPPPPPPHLKVSFEKLFLSCYNIMKPWIVKKPTSVNKFVPRTFHRNMTHSAIITRKTPDKMELKFWKSGQWFYKIH